VLPHRIGRYEVLGQLATGGMAEILLARLSGPSDFARAVVIKRILPQFARSESFVAMFLDEARIVARIRHPNVVQVHELGDHEGDVFLVLEYVAGENLASVLKRAAVGADRLEPELVAHVVAEACAGLHAAHELVTEDGRSQNLVHRDVSPQNLFVGYDGHVKLLDFGVARVDDRVAKTEAGDVKGKFEYMSPEQASGRPLDRRSDIFAMGIVLYELATGRRLFKRTSHARTLDAIVKEPVVPPSRLVAGFPRALEEVILRALAKIPEERYATAADMRRDLLAFARAFPAPVEAVAERMQRWFPERIAEKEEMLRRVRAGDAITRVPAGEVDEDVRVPAVPDRTESASSRTRRRSRAVVAGAVAGAALLASAAALALRGGSTPTVTSSAPSSSALATDAAVSASPPAPSAARDVVVHVESRPPGAVVLADGVPRGATPVDVHLARGSAAVSIELRATGFAPTTQTIIPDADQKLVLALSPVGTRRRTPATAKPRTSAPASSGFRRFD